MSMQVLRKLIFLITFFTTIASAADIPRLWEITGTKLGAAGRFYILAVTHNGLDVEYDDYLIRTVVPIAMRTDAFFYEASVFSPRECPPCPIPLEDTNENRQILRAAYAEVERANFYFTGPGPEVPSLAEQERTEVQQALRRISHDKTVKLSEFGLITAMRTYLYNTLSQHPERLPTWVRESAKLQIADYLAQQRMRRGIKANKSIDAKLDLFNAYCNVDGIHRGRYLLREIAKYDPIKFNPVTTNDRAGLDPAFEESLKRGFLFGVFEDLSDDEHANHMVCDRNEKWMESMRKGLGTGTHFYALGAAHVLQAGPTNDLRCDGLLAKLRQEGFSVTLLKQPSASRLQVMLAPRRLVLLPSRGIKAN